MQFSHPAASRDELHIRKMKLDYQEVCQCSKEVQAVWDRKLSSPCRTKVQWDKEEIHSAVCQGKNFLLQSLKPQDFGLLFTTLHHLLLLHNLLHSNINTYT